MALKSGAVLAHAVYASLDAKVLQVQVHREKGNRSHGQSRGIGKNAHNEHQPKQNQGAVGPEYPRGLLAQGQHFEKLTAGGDQAKRGNDQKESVHG